MFCKTEWEKDCLNLMIFLNLQFSKEEEEFRFIPSEEKLSLLARLASLEKEKLERERRKDKFQFCQKQIEWEIMKCLNIETQCIYLTYILINESFDSWTATYTYLAIFFSPSAHLTSLGTRPSIFLSPLSPVFLKVNPQSVFE